LNAAARDAVSDAPRWVTFSIDDRRFALPLDSVVRIVRAAEITPLPRAPGAVSGAIDVGGRILPVFDLRRLLALPARELKLSDQFVIARSSRRELALVVDATLTLVEARAADDARTLLSDVPHLRGALSLPDGLVLIQDLERFLSPGDESALDVELAAAQADVEKRRAR